MSDSKNLKQIKKLELKLKITVIFLVVVKYYLFLRI